MSSPGKRSGFADLPLHGGRVPPWLAQRMQHLGSAVAEVSSTTTEHLHFYPV